MKRRKQMTPEEATADGGSGRPSRPAGREGKGAFFQKPRHRWERNGRPRPAGGTKGFYGRPGHQGPFKKAKWVSRKEQEKKIAVQRAERLLERLGREGSLLRPGGGRGWYPLDPFGPLCPLLRAPETLWGLIYADRVRHRALLSLAIQFHEIPEEVETSLEQDRQLALRMLDLPDGRRWVEGHEKPSLLVSLHNAIYRLFLQADRSAGDPFFDVTQVLRASEVKDGQTSRSVLSLVRWETVLNEVPELKRCDAKAVALWACAFAMMQPGDAEAILGSLVRAGGELFAGWLMPREKAEAGEIPIPVHAVVEEPSPAASPENEPDHEEKKTVPAGRETGVVEEERIAPEREGPAVAGPCVEEGEGMGGEADSRGSLSAAWERVAERMGRGNDAVTFGELGALVAGIGDLLEARGREIDRAVDLAGRCRFEFSRHPGASELDPTALRKEAEGLETAETLEMWAREVEGRVVRIREEALQAARRREAFEPAVAPIRELSKAVFLGGALRERYQRLAGRLVQDPPVDSTGESLERWAGLGRELIELERGIGSMARALPEDPERYDDNMRSFLRSADILRGWVEGHWMSGEPDVDRARRLFDLLALPKFSWQTTAVKLEEEGFAQRS